MNIEKYEKISGIRERNHTLAFAAEPRLRIVPEISSRSPWVNAGSLRSLTKQGGRKRKIIRARSFLTWSIF